VDISLVSFVIVMVIFLFVFECVRRGVLETKYSILWFITCLSLAFLSLFEGVINRMADLLNVFYAPSLLFLFGLLFALVLIFDMTRRISKLNRQLYTLTQEYSLLQERLESGNDRGAIK
jgi:hypothetical protein